MQNSESQSGKEMDSYQVTPREKLDPHSMQIKKVMLKNVRSVIIKIKQTHWGPERYPGG